MKIQFKNKRAFTLIELLIVIAIIGILFIVLVSKVDFATDKAKASGVQTDFRSFQTAFEQVARENSGFATLGWDTGDDNGDRIRNSYDKGDNGAGGGIAQNGIQDGTEVFVGSKTYGENWTGTYTLVNPNDSKDSSAFVALENAINSNLDPKLHITITPNADASGTLTGSAAITMANQARDPWKNEYAGAYITNATVDSLDRGTIIMYSTGANGKLGVNYSVSGGLVGVEVPGSNINGKDDYVLSVTYSYANGYGEVQTGTAGFSSNQSTLTSTPIVDNGVNAGGMSAGTGSVPGGNAGSAGGSEAPEETEVVAGLYINGEMTTSWTKLIEDGVINVVNGVVSTNSNYVNSNPYDNFSNEYLIGDLLLPNDGSITHIGDYAFYYCWQLDSITLPNTIISIGEEAFGECGLNELIIPNGVLTLGYAALYENRFTNFTIPDSVTTLGNWLFEGTYTLQSIVIGSGVTSIPTGMLAWNEELTNVVFNGTVEKWISLPKGELWNDNIPATYIQCSDGRVDMNGNVIPDGEEILAPGLYRTGTTTLKYTWYELVNSGQLTITNGRLCWQDIDEEDVPKLNGDLVLPTDGSVTNISSAFQGCYGLTGITIGSGIRDIGEDAFSGCTNLRTVNFTSDCNISSIEAYAFYNCDALTNITIPQQVGYIGYQAFYDCNNLSTVTFEADCILTEISEEAFYGCNALEGIIIPKYVEYIYDYAFAECSNLAYLTFEEGSQIQFIYDNAFIYTNLTSITIPNTLRSFGNHVFEGCPLTSLTFEGTKAQWDWAIRYSSYWNNMSVSYVQCSDGNVYT